jgi:hypothetical protein
MQERKPVHVLYDKQGHDIRRANIYLYKNKYRFKVRCQYCGDDLGCQCFDNLNDAILEYGPGTCITCAIKREWIYDERLESIVYGLSLINPSLGADLEDLRQKLNDVEYCGVVEGVEIENADFCDGYQVLIENKIQTILDGLTPEQCRSIYGNMDWEADGDGMPCSMVDD